MYMQEIECNIADEVQLNNFELLTFYSQLSKKKSVRWITVQFWHCETQVKIKPFFYFYSSFRLVSHATIGMGLCPSFIF